jgi:flavin reductase (DIM6/NTAB) family NADH-FMN oxidoreductase RutF
MPGGLYLLGSRFLERRNLMTLNWVMQVCIDPTRVAVSLETTSVSRSLVSDGGCFSVTLVARQDRTVVRKFVRPSEHDPAAHTLAGFAYRDGVSGAPIPTFALGYVDCRVCERLELGSHTLFVGDVVDAGFAPRGEEIAVLSMQDTRMGYGG